MLLQKIEAGTLAVAATIRADALAILERRGSWNWFGFGKTLSASPEQSLCDVTLRIHGPRIVDFDDWKRRPIIDADYLRDPPYQLEISENGVCKFRLAWADKGACEMQLFERGEWEGEIVIQ